MIVDLDAEASLDPARVGSKAASLAMGRRVGLPVLPGFVVETSDSRPHMELGAASLATRGSGGARLSIIEQALPFADALMRSGSDLAPDLVARSSTVLESSGEWSGAFTSYLGLSPAELPRAVAGCWASAFSVAALDRQRAASIQPGSFGMAVLIQPSLQPEFGGAAEIRPDGAVVVHGVKGSPGPLLQGWSTGHTAIRGDAWEGEDLIHLIGVETLDQVADIIHRAEAAVGVNRCEWALEDEVWVLQLSTHHQPASPITTAMGIDDPALIPIAQAAARAPGRLGEELVLPWAMAGLASRPRTTNRQTSALAAAEAEMLRDRLVAAVWDLPADQAMEAARKCASGLLGPDPGHALTRIRSLRPPDRELASRLLDHVDALSAPSHATRLGVGRWEPFIASVTMGFGDHHVGTPASPGIGAGIRAHIDQPGDMDAYKPRSVVTAPQPLPNLAPLLWDAPGVVTETGSPAAHLFESARALGIAAVCGVTLPDGDLIVAVDGTTGVVATMPVNGEDDE